MASIKSGRTWADIQESLNRVRQHYGLLPRAEWDDLIARASYEKAKHKNKNLPRPFLPSLTSKSTWDLGNWEHANTKRHKQHERTQGFPAEHHPKHHIDSTSLCSSHSASWCHLFPRSRAKYDSFSNKPTLVKNKEHDQMKPTLEHSAYRYFTENKHFAGDFVDSFVAEILANEIVPDILIEALTTNTQMPKKKSYDKKSRHWKSHNYRGSAGSHSVSLLDELLIEILRDLSAHVLRRMVRDFVDDHLVRAALHDCIDEMLTSIIQTELSSMVDELNTETEHDRLLDSLIKSVIDKEMKDTVISVLTECDDELSELHKNQITVTANKHVVDMFILEHLLDMIGTHEPLIFGKDPMQCQLDSIMLDVLLRDQVNIQQVQQNTFENYPAMLFHQNTVSKVALEVMLTELHMILVEDMEDICEYEREREFGLQT